MQRLLSRRSIRELLHRFYYAPLRLPLIEVERPAGMTAFFFAEFAERGCLSICCK
jgi:hypothetical protein